MLETVPPPIANICSDGREDYVLWSYEIASGFGLRALKTPWLEKVCISFLYSFIEIKLSLGFKMILGISATVLFVDVRTSGKKYSSRSIGSEYRILLTSVLFGL